MPDPFDITCDGISIAYSDYLVNIMIDRADPSADGEMHMTRMGIIRFPPEVLKMTAFLLCKFVRDYESATGRNYGPNSRLLDELHTSEEEWRKFWQDRGRRKNQ